MTLIHVSLIQSDSHNSMNKCTDEMFLFEFNITRNEWKICPPKWHDVVHFVNRH